MRYHLHRASNLSEASFNIQVFVNKHDVAQPDDSQDRASTASGRGSVPHASLRDSLCSSNWKNHDLKSCSMQQAIGTWSRLSHDRRGSYMARVSGSDSCSDLCRRG
eukprot:TRINITY_DN2872_c1_g1_i3.p1 TRINITY_DN2872_c1_g1~~TRINITY_DN2872_c1_g1_i3.p1  ORF type:complete len:106 (-),score=5.93 TRINITY_DN2872_c1_g1_i3:91-408(-)